MLFAWDRSMADPPDKWYRSAFMGNGALGMMVRTTSNGSATVTGLQFDIGHTAVYDD
eukprot:gene10501-9235_t